MSSDWPPLRKALWPIALLFLAANLYSIDKGIVGVLAEPIRADLGIGDREMGLLLGLAYSLLSAVLGLGLGWLVDHRTRVRVLAGAILLWSVSTVACGLAEGFAHFFVARALVGLGEAAVAPCALSLIADLVAPERRGRALSAYFVGASIGSGLSSVIPGAIVKAGIALDLPFVGPIAPWRSAFVLCGLAGPIVAALFLTVAEPPRHGVARGDEGLGGLGAKFARLWTWRAALIPLYAGFCLFYVALIGLTSWTAVFLGRTWHIGIAEIGPKLGLMLLVTGIGGYVLSGALSDSHLGRGGAGRTALLVFLPLLGLPSAFAGLAPGPGTALVLLGAIGTAMPMINIATNAAVQDIVPNAMRGFAYAVLGLAAALTAGWAGPWLVAVTAEKAGSMGAAFALVTIPFCLASSLAFAFARRAVLDAVPAGEIR